MRRKKKEIKKVPTEAEMQRAVAEILTNINSPVIMPAGDHLPYASFYGHFNGLDFMDANIGLVPFGYSNKERSITETVLTYSDCKKIEGIPLDEVVRTILTDETTFDLSNYKIISTAEGARSALMQVLGQLVSPERPFVVYGSPNWVFEKVTANVPGAKSISFLARSPDEFIKGVDSIAQKEKVAAVIVVDPSNPLGYRFKEGHVQELEKIAETYGFVTVFDDVFRGMQSKGSRHSSSEYSNNSVIIETTSKRYGARGLGVTWTLVPDTLNIKGPVPLSEECEGCHSLASFLTKGLHETGYGERVRHYIISNSQSFFRGFRKFYGNSQVPGFFNQSFDAMPIITYHLDGISEVYSSDIITEAVAKQLGITNGVQWISDFNSKQGEQKLKEILFGATYLRICPTKENPERSFVAGYLLAEQINVLRSKIHEKK